MKKLSGLAAVCVMVALISVASAEIYITELQPFPDTIYAGSGYTAKYQITNTGEESSPLNIHFSIINEDFPVNVNETDVNVSVDTSELNCSEIAPGNFTCEIYTIPTGATINVDIYFSSVPNFMPDTNYISTILFTYKETHEPVQVTYRRGGGGDTDFDDDGISNLDEVMAGTDRYNPCDPDPYNEACYARGGARPTPTPTPTPTPEVTPEATPTPEVTPTPTPVTVPPEKKSPWWILGIVGAGAGAGIGAWLWKRWRQNQ